MQTDPELTEYSIDVIMTDTKQILIHLGRCYGAIGVTSVRRCHRVPNNRSGATNEPADCDTIVQQGPMDPHKGSLDVNRLIHNHNIINFRHLSFLVPSNES